MPHKDVKVGNDSLTYEVVEDWAKLPKGWSFVEVAGVAADNQSRVYVFNRGAHPMMVFDRAGNLLHSWGEKLFSSAHSVRIGSDGMVYCADFGDHTVRKFTPEGELIATLGTPNKASDTGAVDVDYRTIKRVAGPFNKPTDIAFDSSGRLYVSDGYGNARVHVFSKDGELLSSWGSPGSAPGQFHLPHSVFIDRKNVLYVADRENGRIQLFTLEGKFIEQWKDSDRPTCVHGNPDGTLVVTELGYGVGMFEGNSAPPGRNVWARVTTRSPDGKILAEWKGVDGCAPGNFFAPHTICVDPRGDIYVGEVTHSTNAPAGCHALQKFVRR